MSHHPVGMEDDGVGGVPAELLDGEQHIGDTAALLDTESAGKPQGQGQAAGGQAGQGQQGQEQGQQPQMMMCGCLSVDFYKPYFNVDTVDVGARVLASVVFWRREETLLALVGSNPDMWFPFWAATTLLFLVAVVANVSSWINYTSADGEQWEYDFQLVVTGASLIYGFAAFVPAVLWFTCKQLDVPLSLVSALCLYGYSFTTFLLATLLCLIPNDALTWTVLVVGCAWSTLFLLSNIAPLMVQHSRENAVFVLAGIGVCQLAFMLALKLIFFSSSSSSDTSAT